MKNIFSFSCFLLFSIASHSTQSLADSSELVGKYMVFAVGYGTSDKLMNNHVLVGDYKFNEQTIVAEYKEFDANANFKPKKADLHLNMEAPYRKQACRDKLIDIPSASNEISVKGTWYKDGKILKLTINTQTYEWEAEDGNEGAFKLRSIRDNVIKQDLPLAVGFAYISKVQNAPAKLKKENFLSYYRGDIYHKNNYAVAKTPWELQSTGLKISIFSESNNGNVLNYSTAGNVITKGAWVGNGILLNYNKKSSSIIYQDLGHDFNKNGCYDEYGHNKVILAVHNNDTPSIIRNMLFIEYSYAFDGFPLLSVGRYYR